MKTSRFKSSYRKNSSKLHKRIGDVLRESSSPFSGYRIYQEYPVNKICTSYPHGSHKYDWVILDLHLVIEGHGQQHYEPATFGGVSTDEAIDRFQDQKLRDRQKLDAAIEAGFTYIEVPFSDFKRVTAEYLWELYLANRNEQPIVQQEEVRSKYHQEQLERAREYRRQRYRRQKQCLDAFKKQRRSIHGPQTSRYQSNDSPSSNQKVENPR